MAVYTTVDDTALNSFLAAYDIGEILSFAGIAEGVENSNYLLRTTKAHFILTLYEKRVDADDLPFFIELMTYLSADGMNCPLPVAERDGQILHELAGDRVLYFHFLMVHSHEFQTAPNAKRSVPVWQSFMSKQRRVPSPCQCPRPNVMDTASPQYWFRCKYSGRRHATEYRQTP